MPKSNADAFPAHGNHHGKTAGVNIDLAFDLLTGIMLESGRNVMDPHHPIWDGPPQPSLGRSDD